MKTMLVFAMLAVVTASISADELARFQFCSEVCQSVLAPDTAAPASAETDNGFAKGSMN